MVLKRHKEGVVVQPVLVFIAPGVVSGVAARRAFPRQESFAEQGSFPADHRAIVDALRREAWPVGKGRAAEQTVVRQLVQTDEHRVARKGRKALIGRVGVARWAKRQQLPDRLPRRDEPIHEAIGRIPQLPDAMGAGQRGGMQQDARLSWELHGGSFGESGVSLISAVRLAVVECWRVRVDRKNSEWRMENGVISASLSGLDPCFSRFSLQRFKGAATDRRRRAERVCRVPP